MRRGAFIAGLGLAALFTASAAARAHAVTPDLILEQLGTPEAKAQGVERAEVQAGPKGERRLLVIEVGPAWKALPRDQRRALAHRWYMQWRHAVRTGVVSVLDASSGLPVVRFGPTGSANLVEERVK